MTSGPANERPGTVGDRLPELEKQVTAERVEAYAEAAGDFNPIHMDEEFARTTQFGRRIGHGMLILAFVSEMMALAFPDGWPSGGRLRARFKAPVYLGETVTTFGEIVAIRGSEQGPIAECRVGCRKADGSEAVSARAFVPLAISTGR
ncbi:MAG: MaoC family dehydratase [Gemmatimonadetes bacterium]|nr:MaoC family dehydratase [Gemmatimonadota bacterium]